MLGTLAMGAVAEGGVTGGASGPAVSGGGTNSLGNVTIQTGGGNRSAANGVPIWLVVLGVVGLVGVGVVVVVRK